MRYKRRIVYVFSWNLNLTNGYEDHNMCFSIRSARRFFRKLPQDAVCRRVLRNQYWSSKNITRRLIKDINQPERLATALVK